MNKWDDVELTNFLKTLLVAIIEVDPRFEDAFVKHGLVAVEEDVLKDDGYSC